MKPIIICGPTATGKSELAVRLCEHFGGEVISADSMQIYRRLNVGTAKPTEKEMRGIPHHLIDIREPNEKYSVNDFVADAHAAMENIAARGKCAVIVGGTGLYISALLDGMAFEAPAPDEALRATLLGEYDEKGGEAMLSRLYELDPKSAQRLHANDRSRITRAMEVCLSSGRTMSEFAEMTKANARELDAVRIGLNFGERAKLYEHINARVDGMMQRGLVEEARYVYENRECFVTAAQAIGYKELFGYFEGADTLEECTERLKMQTRRYAKRQLTWFARDKKLMWLRADDPDAAFAEALGKCAETD